MQAGETRQDRFANSDIQETNSMEFETRGIVIREYPQKERDKLLVILTPDMGKISVWATGARAPRSALLSVSQLMAYSRLKIRQSGGRFYLVSGEVEQLFFELRSSIEKLSLAQYFCELTDSASADGLEAESVLSLLLNSLYMLCKNTVSERAIKAAFEMRLMSYIGYKPRAEECSVCGGVDDEMFFDLEAGVIMCRKCMGESANTAFPINRAVHMALKYIINADAKKIFSFKIDEESEKILAKATEGYLLTQLDIKLNTLDFYNAL